MPFEEGDVTKGEARRIDEELDREEERTRRLRQERLRRRYRQSIPVAAAIFFTAAILWALTGAILPFLQESAFASGGGNFTELVRKINFAAQSVSYAGLFTLGGVLIVTHLTRRTSL
ncbi:MAG TPA: hypothetical protein VF986_01920 [Actinomycetota bacterium]